MIACTNNDVSMCVVVAVVVDDTVNAPHTIDNLEHLEQLDEWFIMYWMIQLFKDFNLKTFWMPLLSVGKIQHSKQVQQSNDERQWFVIQRLHTQQQFHLERLPLKAQQKINIQIFHIIWLDWQIEQHIISQLLR